MNLNLKPAGKNSEGFRRLQWHELVSVGDFIADEHREFEPWEGPNGFRANALVKPIYRRDVGRLAANKKLK